MNAPSFWWRRWPSPAAIALQPLAWMWGSSVARRMRRQPAHWPPAPVICIGNFTVGGEGKTPTAIAIGEIARDIGVVPGFLTRGYGGNERGPVLVSDQHRHPRRVGDEPCLLAEIGPTVVSGDRPKGARLLLQQGVDIIIMDDGFQNPHLGKDLTLVVIDAEFGLGNRLVTPAGPLRAPLRTQLHLADAIVLIGEGGTQPNLVRIAARAGKHLLRARLKPLEPDRWRDKKVLAFAGIGRPEKFFSALEQAGAGFAGRNAFPDHHYYTEAEAEALLRHAHAGDITLVTTEKDHARLAETGGVLAELRQETNIFAVRLDFEAPDMIRGLVKDTIDAVRAGRSRRRPGSGV